MMQTIQSPDGRSLAFDERGPTDAAGTLVLLHGGGLDHRMWEPQLDAFPDLRVIAPDAASHGQSSTAQTPYRLVDDVVHLLDTLDISTAVVAGVSMGGGTAVDLAVEMPERVRALVVSGTGTSDPEFTDPWCLEILGMWQAAVEQGDPELWVQGFQRFVPGPHRTVDQVAPHVVEVSDAMVRNTLNSHVLPVVARGETPVQPTQVDDVNSRRHEIHCPVLALTGAVDADDHQRFTRELLDAVPDGREVLIADSAHYPNLERPSTFNDALASFVRGLPGRLG